MASTYLVRYRVIIRFTERQLMQKFWSPRFANEIISVYDMNLIPGKVFDPTPEVAMVNGSLDWRIVFVHLAVPQKKEFFQTWIVLARSEVVDPELKFKLL